MLLIFGMETELRKVRQPFQNTWNNMGGARSICLAFGLVAVTNEILERGVWNLFT